MHVLFKHEAYTQLVLALREMLVSAKRKLKGKPQDREGMHEGEEEMNIEQEEGGARQAFKRTGADALCLMVGRMVHQAILDSA